MNDYNSQAFKKTVCTHDNNGNIISVINFNWNEDRMCWYMYDKYTFEYDKYGNLTTKCRYLYRDNQWEERYKDTYLYTKENKTTILYYWDGSTWELDKKVITAYNELGHETTAIIYEWNTKNGEWEKSMKEEYSLDEKGNKISEIMYDYDAQYYSWKKSQKYTSIYDDKGNQTSHTTYLYISGEFRKNSKAVYKYNSQGNVMILENWSDNYKSGYKVKYTY